MRVIRSAGFCRQLLLPAWGAVCQRSWDVRQFVVIATLLLLSMPAPLWGQIRRGTNEEGDVRNGAFSPAPRELRQLLLRAQKALADKQNFAEAVELLLQIPDEDYFLGRAADTGMQQSAKAKFGQLLSQLPTKGREMYELALGAEARKALEDALRSRRLEDLARVSSKYQYTKAGMEATFLLGRLQLQLGQPAAAAIAFDRLSESVAGSSTSFDPELSLLQAIAWHRSGKTERAVEILVALKQRQPNAKFTAGGVPSSLFVKEDEAAQWLSNWVGEFVPTDASLASQWTMPRGNPERSASVEAGAPLTYFRWSQPLVYDRQDEDRVKQSSKKRRENGLHFVPALQPLVVGEQVFMRTPDRVVGVDLRTGRALWVYPWDESNFERAAKSGMQSNKSPLSQTRDRELNSRLWIDNNFGQMSSDGDRLYLVDELSVAENGFDNMRFMGGPGRAFSTSFPGSVSKLVALSLKKQGALQWVIGGETGGDEPALAGAFFLGAPLPAGDMLYALVDVGGEVRMVCLEPKSGKLLWKQSLVSLVDRSPIERDRNRRVAGTTPSLSSGILVCPTSAEAVIAIDLATRRLLWGHQYAKSRPVNLDPFDGNGARSSEQESPIWLDSSVVIADGLVLMTPMDSTVMLGLDLFTGKPRWPNIDRGDMLFIGCVHRQTVLMVGRKQLQAFSLADGKPAWKEPLALEDEQPSGRGFYNGEHYFLPTTGQQLLKIDIVAGKVVDRLKTQTTLGNLVAYKEDLISQGTDQVTAFYMSEPLQRRVDERLAKNGKDSWALARQGELLFQSGKPNEALTSLREAVASDVSSDSARLQLSRVMLALLTSDYKTYKSLMPELEKLIDSPELSIELLKTVGQGLEAEGDLAGAFGTYLRLADQVAALSESTSAGATPGATSGLWEVTRGHSISPTRWIHSRLAAVYAGADDAAKQFIATEVETRAKSVLTDPGPDASRRFLDLLAFHPSAEPVRQARAARLIQAGNALELELVLGELAHGSNAVVAGQSCWQLAKMYADLGRLDLSMEQYQRLQSQFADVVVAEGKTGADIAREAMSLPALLELQNQSRIEAGKVLVTTKPSAASNTATFNVAPYPVQLSDVRGAVSRDLRVGYVMQQNQLYVRPAGGQHVTKILLPTPRGNDAGFTPTSNVLPGRLAGHAMVVCNGRNVLAVDLLRRPRSTRDAVMWQLEISEQDQSMQGRITRPISNPLLSTPLTPNFIQVPVNAAGPITSRGIAILRGKQLLCVDALTGKTLWERSGIDLQSELLGDENRVVVALGKTDDCLVLSMVDGSVLDRRKIDKAENRLAISGRNVLAWERVASALRLRLYDAAGPSKPIWTEQIPNGSKGAMVGNDELAVLMPDGNFLVVSLASGQVLVKTMLQPETRLESLLVHKSMGQYTVLVNSVRPDSSPASQYIGLSLSNIASPKVNGPVYGIDAKSGSMVWQVPAHIEHQAFLVDQPLDQPVMLFGKNQLNNSQRSGRAGGNCTILAIDRRDGSLIAEFPAFTNAAQNYEVNYDRVKREVVLKLMASQEEREIHFQFTSEPVPPQPPAQLGSLSSLAPGRIRGNEGVFGAILGAINRTQKAGEEKPAEVGDDPFGPGEEDEDQKDPFGNPFK